MSWQWRWRSASDEILGKTLAGIAAVVNPEIFVIGGGVSKGRSCPSGLYSEVLYAEAPSPEAAALCSRWQRWETTPESTAPRELVLD